MTSPTWKDWLLPSSCALCGGSAKHHDHLCDACRAELPLLNNHCPRCGNAMATGETCADCLAKPPPFVFTFAHYRYAHPLDRLIQDFKYGGQLALTPTLGGLLLTTLRENPEQLATCNAVIAMPLARLRQIERGFNQAQELSRYVARALKLPILSDVLCRIKDTPKQSTLSLAERHRHLRDAFACTRPLDQYRPLLIDDVMTTGTTLRAAAQCLQGAGAQQVMVAVVARAV